MTTALCLHRGAQRIGYDALGTIAPPEPTETWYLLAHQHVLNTTLATLKHAGFQPARIQLAVSADQFRFFGTIDLRSPIADGVSLSVGIRNSNDTSLPIGFTAGNRVFVCDNLAFSSDTVVSRKHTRFGANRFAEAMARAVSSLIEFQAAESRRIETFQRSAISDTVAESLILRAFDREIVSAPMLAGVVNEWREPSHVEFSPRTLWSLENAFTEYLKPVGARSPQRFTASTMALHALLAEAATPQFAVAI